MINPITEFNMDFLAKKIFGIDLDFLRKTRKNQLERQSNIDKMLIDKCGENCSQKVTKYFALHRELARKQQNELIKTDVTKYFDIMKLHLEQNELFYGHIEEALNNSNPCGELEEIMRRDTNVFLDPSEEKRTNIERIDVGDVSQEETFTKIA